MTAAVLAVACGSASLAAEIAADSFLIGSNPGGGEYSAGDLVPQNPTLSTFNSAWADGLTTTTTGTFDAVSTGLFWPDLPGLGGGSVQFENATSIATTQSAVRGFTNPVTYNDGVYYMAGLMSFDENFSTATTSVAFTGLLNAEEGDLSVPWVIGSQWGFQGNGEGGVDAVFRARQNLGDNVHEAATDVIASGISPGTHMFVIKVQSDYTPNSSYDLVSIWLDPDLNNSEISVGPPDLAGDYTNWLDPTEPRRTVKNFVFNATDVGDGAVVGYDEVRIGETWDNIVAQPGSDPYLNLQEGSDSYEHLGAEVRSRLDGGDRKLGSGSEILIGNDSIGTGGNGVFRGLLAFGTEGVPDGATVTDVELVMSVKRTSLITGVDGMELRLTDPAVDMIESEVTWNNINDTTPWTEGGGDPTATVLSSIPGFGNELLGQTVNFEATTEFLSAVQAAVDGDDLLEMVMMSPAAELILDERNFVGFWSDDATAMSLRPVLRILYEEGQPLTPGDANGDGYVDVSDLGILATNYGIGSGLGWGDADFTGDGVVDVSDLGILATAYGTVPTAQSVPEPSAAVMLAGVALSVFFLRRRGS